MNILEDDGSYITFEVLEPKWTVAEVHRRHYERIAKEFEAVDLIALEHDWEEAELVPRVSGARGSYTRLTSDFCSRHWYRLSKAARDRIDAEQSGDYREANGMQRHDGKPIAKTTKRVEYEKLADQFGIPTNDTATGPWRRLVREAVAAAEPQGRIGEV